MVIKDMYIKISTAEADRISPRAKRFRVDEERYVGELHIVSDTGLEGEMYFYSEPTIGYGFSKNSCYKTASEILGLLKKEMIGRDIHDREWLHSQRYVYQWWGHVSAGAISTVDCALWDLAGKAVGLPVYKMLGACRHKIPAYSSGPYYPEPQRHADLARISKEAGYTAFKIKPAGDPAKKVMEIADLTRKAVGDDMALMLDGQLRYSYEDALAIGKHLQALNFEWFEDPLQHDDLTAIDRLCGRLDMPIALSDHKDFTHADMAQMILRKNGLRILRSDAGREGVTGLKKTVNLAESFGLRCEIHTMSMTALHVALTTNCCHYFEDTLQDVLDDKKEGIRERADGHPYKIDKEGYVHAPTEPGLGLGFDWTPFKQNKIETIR